MGDSVPKHARPISLTDTPLESEHLQNTTDQQRRESPETESLLHPERLKLLADASFVDRN